MQVYLLRHGKTEYNAQKRYQGQRNIPLSPEGRAQLCRADVDPGIVYVSPLVRARQTAEIFFPQARQIVVRDLQEMCFGSFEGRTFVHVEQDPEYLEWLAANENAAHPDGERMSDFCSRTCAAFSRLVDSAAAAGEERLVIVAHGGTQMAVMSRYALPRKSYHDWCGPNAGGYLLDAARWQTDRTLDHIKTVQYTKENAECRD